MNKFFFAILFFISYGLSAQDTLTLQLRPVMGKAPLALEKKYLVQNDTLEINTLKFYLSDIVIYNDNSVPVANKKYHLVDLENPNSLMIKFIVEDDKSITRLKFKTGIDSLTNVSGAMGGDLDPLNGMYWTWQSGYINMKTEGVAKQCPTRNNRFQLHVGGYQFPFNALQEMEFKTGNRKTITINIAFDDFLAQTFAAEQYEVMSPSLNAVEIAKRFAHIFRLAE